MVKFNKNSTLEGVGAGDVPEPVRDRVELPADEPGAGPHVDPPAGAAAAVRGAVAGAAQRVGVAASGGALHAATRRSGDPPGAAATADTVAMAAPGDRRGVRDGHRDDDGKEIMFITSGGMIPGGEFGNY